MRGLRRRAASRLWLPAALALASALALAAEPLPLPPPCTVGDAVVAGDPDRDHATLVLDAHHRLSADYEPSDLVSVAAAGFAGAHLLRAVVIEDLAALRTAAVAEGVALAVQSAYRSFAYQEQVHARWVAALGAERARRVSARPGHSEHQLGTAVDFTTDGGPPPWELADWAQTPEGAFLEAHAHRFGFVMSYPRDAEARSCYDYEPWHYRWVGRDLAAAVHASGEPLRAYLFTHFPPSAAP
jgi:zinc D-Ala-D-Ala carboxypeptidase